MCGGALPLGRATPLRKHTNIMKIFHDHKAQKRWNEFYETFQGYRKEMFAEKCRELADKKINSEEGEYDEFYLTVKDINELASHI